jgi:hypothetical protein
MNNRFKALEGLVNVKPRKFAFEMMWVRVILHVRHSGLNIRSRWNSFLPKCRIFLNLVHLLGFLGGSLLWDWWVGGRFFPGPLSGKLEKLTCLLGQLCCGDAP